MTYREVLEYQERSMNALLCWQWIGFTSERQEFVFALQDLRGILHRSMRRDA